MEQVSVAVVVKAGGLVAVLLALGHELLDEGLLSLHQVSQLVVLLLALLMVLSVV